MSIIFNAKTFTNIATRNVRTLYQCGRTEEVKKEMEHYKLDMLGVSEMRWTGQGRMDSRGKTVLCSGNEQHHIPSCDIKLVIGDFNSKLSGDRRGIPSSIGPRGSADDINDNGERLLSICSISSLSIGNTFFKHKRIHKNTWTSPDGNTSNEIDYQQQMALFLEICTEEQTFGQTTT